MVRIGAGSAIVLKDRGISMCRPHFVIAQAGCCLYGCPVLLRFRCVICMVSVRYITGQIPDKYRTSSGQIANKYAYISLATPSQRPC